MPIVLVATHAGALPLHAATPSYCHLSSLAGVLLSIYIYEFHTTRQNRCASTNCLCCTSTAQSSVIYAADFVTADAKKKDKKVKKKDLVDREEGADLADS